MNNYRWSYDGEALALALALAHIDILTLDTKYERARSRIVQTQYFDRDAKC
jgi:hypothetical protein